MTIQLTSQGMREILPKAPASVIAAFASERGQRALDKAGITQTRARLVPFFANIEHECGGFTIKNLTENINYSAERMAAVWPKRFPGGAADVRRKYGAGPGWQKLAFDDIYGNRMGNHPGSHDGSTFIGHGGPQWTGRDGHEALLRILYDLIPDLPKGLDADGVVLYAVAYEYQPEVCAAFWIWKGLNAKADVGDFLGIVKIWNGGTNGYEDRLRLKAGNDAPISRLKDEDTLARFAKSDEVKPVAKALPGGPDTPKPPQDVIDATTKKERAARGTGIGGAAGGVGNEGGKIATKSSTEQPTKIPFLTTPQAIGLASAGVILAVTAAVLIARKVRKVHEHWN